MLGDSGPGEPRVHRLDNLETLGKQLGEGEMGHRPVAPVEHEQLGPSPFADDGELDSLQGHG